MYKAVILSHFVRQLKPYLKKHRSLKDDVIFVLDNFNKRQGVSLGNNVYKIRLKTKSISKGKSKSFRLVVLLVEIENIIAPIALYFKGDKENISKKEINNHLDIILSELRLGIGK